MQRTTLPNSLLALYKTAVRISQHTDDLDRISDAWSKVADACDLYLMPRRHCGKQNADVVKLRDKARSLQNIHAAS